MIRLLLLSAIAFLLAGCERPYRWSQQLEIVIETPDGVVTASTVQEMTAYYTPEFIRINGFALRYVLKGEALVADLGDGKYLFALLPAERMAERTLADFRASPSAQLSQVRAARGAPPVPILREVMPWLVTFGSVDDPLTLDTVDPDNLAATFGPGYALQSLTVAIVDDSATLGRVDTLLPWLKEWKELFILGGQPASFYETRTGSPDAYEIMPLHFTTERQR